MAFSTGIGDRTALKSPREETSFASLTSPLRSVGTQLSSAPNDARGQLHRRFTTNNMPTLSTPLSPIGQQRRQAAEPQEFTSATFHKLQVLEKKKLEYEYLKEQRRRFEAEMELLDLQSRREEEEISRLSSDIQYGKHSQPTTPPEFGDSNGFPTAFSRPNRFSMSSITPGMTTPRGSRSGSLLMSPPSANATNGLPSKSVPGSRRNSDEEGDEFDQDSFSPMSPVHRTSNRMSMPANLNRNKITETGLELGHVNTAAYLFGRDEEKQQASAADDKFPVLLRHQGEGNVMQLSATSAALDLASSQSPGPESQNNGWPTYRHRHAQQSLPTNTLRKGSQVEEFDVGRVNGGVETTPTKAVSNNRRSVEFSLSSYGSESKRSSFASPSNGTGGMPKLQQSYSTNDVPTLKSNGVSGTNGTSAMRSHAEQHLHNHNANMGRIPANGISGRHSRELSTGFKDHDASYRQLQSGLHASAAPFGPALTSAPGMNGSVAGPVGVPTPTQYGSGNPPYYGYSMNMLNETMGGMNLQQQFPAPGFNYTATPGPNVPPYFNPYATYGPSGRVQDSQARVIQSRRLQSDANRYMNYDLKTMPRTEIYALCKDQHGCRFLQKKLEERNPEYMEIIFEETAPHVVELMTDPFGNYLCQKLLEFTNDQQRDVLVSNAAPSLVQIALNQHGTRALQKMIEFISTPNQIRLIIEAFSGQVVKLIQDLNGNHVIQKCLNHLDAADAQFIFDAVGANCVTVGTHRHGCCVLQRCIDHASGFQKVQLVRQITQNSYNLVQDPFGNYVVQYILDLNDASFTNPLCLNFAGQVASLSKQKFSSNVIEKCIRCADMNTKRVLIEELMESDELEKLMRDSYGNYVIQTALEFAPPDLCLVLMESMRPLLPAIRQTPYGRRIQSKVQERESRLAAFNNGRTSDRVSPHNVNVTTTQVSEDRAGFGPVPRSAAYPAAPVYTGNAYNSNIASPQPHRMSNPPLPMNLDAAYQQQQFGNGAGNDRSNFF